MGFFGLTSKHRKDLHLQIFQIIYHGQGGFTHSDVYSMPTYLRNFYYKELVDTKKQESDEIKKAKRKSKPKKIQRPSINPRFKR